MFLKTGFKLLFGFLLAILIQLGSKAQTWPGDTIHVNINTGNPTFPFPQFLEYENGQTLAANNAVGVTHADMEKAMREAYQIMMHRALYVPGKSLGGTQYIQFNNSTVPQNYGTFVSEGDGYALLAAAYFADKKTFDGLWMWIHDNRLSGVKKYLDCTPLRAGYTYGAGFAGWNDTDADGVGSTNVNSAGDGDVDIAMALLIASKQWPAGMGTTDACGNPISYKTEALKMIKVLVDTLYYTTSPFGAQAGVKGYLSGIVGIDGYIKSGNTWGEVTNWRYTAANTIYPWALAKPDPIQVNSPYVDYNAPAYFNEFADFLAANGGTAWEISQCKRCASSGDWTIGQMYSKGYIASAGNYTVSDNGATTTFGSFAAGEDFRCSWRTILNYVWHGNPDSSWNAATHQIVPGGNTYEYSMALRQKDFLKFPNSIPGTAASAYCSTLGASPDPSCPNWRGVAQIKQQYAPNGSVLANYGVNWMVGTGMPSAVASGDLDLTAELYRQCELLWDDQSGSQTLPDYQRYIGSTPKYFHGWFRTLGMLTGSGNLHPPDKMVAAANIKVYMAVDKTFAYGGDLITYTISYRNYGTVAAAGVKIVTTLDSDYQFVSATGGGSNSGGTITWNIGSIPGFVTGGLAATQGTVSFVVRVNPTPVHSRVCLTSTITASNAPSWISNEYPNNATYTMERNCVDLLLNRVLAIQKTTDRPVMNSGDVVNFTLNFQNKTGSNLWLNGGRDRVVMSYANYYPTNGTDFYQFYRIWHSAHEAYINLGNYRISYFMNDGAAIGQYNAATNPTGWSTYVDNQNDLNKYGYNPTTLPLNQQLNFTYQKIPWGSDANGSWNQRIVTQFAQVLSAPSSHIYDKLDSEYLIHKGVVGPGFTRTRIASNPSSILQSRLTDDWSYSTAVANTALDGQAQRFFPVSPTYTNDATNFAPVSPVNYSKDVCDATPANFQRVLVEEFDGYTWRRIAGLGPLPGRETYNVTVTDSIPIQLSWNGFTAATTLGVTATYTALTGNPNFSGYVKWTVPVMLVGESGLLTYSTIAKSPCAEKTFVNAGWIWSDVDSPDSSAVNLKLTCTQVPPTPPVQTSLVKTADKTSAVVGDVVTYTLTFTNQSGSTASWAGSSTSASDWQALGNGVIPKLTGSVISLDQNGGNTPPGTYGYGFGLKKSHGVNGYIDATIVPTNSSTFSFIYRYQSGTPGQSDFQGLRLDISPNIGGNNFIAFTLYNNTTPIATITGLSFGGSANPIKIKTQLVDDKLYIWINDYTGAPLKVISGITQLNAGYAGIYANGSQQTLSSYTTHFDSAFDLMLSDPVPAQLNGVANISNAGVLTGTTVTWPTVPGPILANAVITRTFTAVVNTCTNFITNIATASVYGVSNIQSQYVITCGTTTPPCTKPNITSATTGAACSGVAQNYAITSDLPSTYSWTRAVVTGISNTAGSGNTSSITETLTNTTAAPINVVYVITPTSTAQTCVGPTFNYTVTVNASPTITGTLGVCIGSTTTLTGSGTAATTSPWVSASTAVATVSSTGVVTGVSAGTSVITYTNNNGCKQTATVTVTALPTITGTLSVCISSTTTLVGSGTAATTSPWTSATTSVATVSSTGVVTGVSAGTSVITYVNSNGCGVTATVTVNPQPTITGTLSACIGSTTTLTGSGTAATTNPWVSTTTSVATVSNTGVVTGVAAGTSVITYTNNNGCGVTATVTVTGLPTITGTLTVCAGLTTTLTGSGTAATTSPWTSATTSVATVDNAGAVTGVSAGTSVITYTNNNGCKQTATVTVNALPTITGTLSVCAGLTTTLTGSGTPATTGTWSSASTAAATVSGTNSTSGVVTAVAAGSSVITYTNSTGCKQTATVTVNALPTITGTLTVCAGLTTTLTGSGTAASTNPWVSATTSVATVDNAGVVTGVAAGTSVITYTNSNGCIKTATVTVTGTVTASVAIATPSTSVCTGTSITFTATPTGGGTTPTYQWMLNNTAITSATNATYTTTTAADNDSYTVVMTSTAACASPATVTSNPIVITITTAETPAVTITASPGTTVCAGTGVTFTANPGGGGSAPTYKWYVNGALAGATNVTYLSSVLLDGDQVMVKMVSNSSCATTPNASSNVLTMSITAAATPSVAAAADNTTICPGATITFTATPTQGGTTPTYQWKKNGTAISGETNSTYVTTGAANNDVYTVDMKSNAACAPTAAVTSNPVTITVTPVPTISVSITADNATICANNPVNYATTVTGSGATPAPTYEWFITSSATAGSGTSQGAASTTATTFGTSALTATNNKVYVQVVSNAACAATTAVASNVVAVTVNAGITAGSIGSDQTICYNGTVAALTELTTSTAVTPSYAWEAGTSTSGPWTAIPGATNANYTPPAVGVTTDVYLHRVVTDGSAPSGCASATSNIVHITVLPQLVAGAISADETTCSGAATTAMTSTLPTGGTGSFTYQWQSNTSSATGTYTDIAGATNATYPAGNLTTTTYYQLVYTSVYNTTGTCGSVTSTTPVTKTVTTTTIPTVSINDPGQTCDGTGMTFTATAAGAGTTPTYQWYLGTNPVGTNSNTYAYTAAIGDNGKSVTVKVTSSDVCSGGPVTSAPVVLNIAGATTPTVAITTPTTQICVGMPATFTATGTGTGGSPSFQWYENGNPVGTNSPTYTSTTLASSTDQVWVSMTSSLACIAAGASNPVLSNKVSIAVKPIPTPAIVQATAEICSSEGGFTFTSSGTNTGSNLQWQLNTKNISGATGSSYYASDAGDYTLVEDNGSCTVTSNPSTLSIIANPVAYAGPDLYVTEGTFVQLQASGGTSGTAYSWTPTTGLSSSTISNPSFKAENTTTYTVTLSNTGGASGTKVCTGQSSVTVVVVKPIVVPNVITVNGDGSNDTWKIQNIEGFPNATFEIFNRWGNLVWKSTGYPKQWDGTNFRNGEVLPDGTYFYIIDLHSPIFTDPYTGWIQIIK